MDKKKTQLTGILIVSMLTCASLVAVITLSPLDKGTYTYKLNTFQSYDELLSFLQKRYENGANQGRFTSGGYNIAIEKSAQAPATDGADLTGVGLLPSWLLAAAPRRATCRLPCA